MFRSSYLARVPHQQASSRRDDVSELFAFNASFSWLLLPCALRWWVLDFVSGSIEITSEVYDRSWQYVLA